MLMSEGEFGEIEDLFIAVSILLGVKGLRAQTHQLTTSQFLVYVYQTDLVS